MKPSGLSFLGVVLLPMLLASVALCQSTFQNLDFEDANVSGYSSPSAIPTTDGIPDWTAYISMIPQTSIGYNLLPLSSAAVTLQGPDGYMGSYPAISGNYSLMLWREFNPSQLPNENHTAAIGQTCQVPVSAQSISFWGTIGGMQVTFNGQPLTFSTIGNAATYKVYAADISAYAGQTGQLLFNNLPYSNTTGGPASLDNIQFSDQPAPEPSAFALGALGLLLFCWRFRK